MKNLTLMALAIFYVILLSNCSSDSETDTEYPVIDISSAQAFPKQCSSVDRGKKFTFRARFSDNLALGSFSLDIHHNFDHHSHSTEISNCEFEAVKTAVKPFLFIKDYSIPEGQTSYEATVEIEVPVDADPGDYHFMIRLTDKEGWQTIKGLSIKLQ